MKKLEYNIVLTVPEAVCEKAREDVEDFPIVEQITIEIYHEEEKDDGEWETYSIKILELDDEFGIIIASSMMDISRQIEKDGGGQVEEFIYEMVMNQIRQDAEEAEIRDFFDDISD